LKFAQIKLQSLEIKTLTNVCQAILDLSAQLEKKTKGPIPLPTKRLIVPVRKSPDGEGTETWDRWEMRIHRRLLYVEADDRLLRRIFRLDWPDRIEVEIRMV